MMKGNLCQQTAGTHRCGEAVIGGRADSYTTALGLSPRESWPPVVCCTVSSPQNAARIFLTNGPFTGSVQLNLYQGTIDRTARASVLLPCRCRTTLGISPICWEISAMLSPVNLAET